MTKLFVFPILLICSISLAEENVPLTNNLIQNDAMAIPELPSDQSQIQPDRIKIITGSPALAPTKLPRTMTPSKTKTVSPACVPTRVPTSAPVYSTDYSCVHANAWLVNTDNQYSNLYGTNVDVITSAFVNTSVSTTGWMVSFNGIPFYGHVFTQDEIDTLNARPRAATDFTTGQTTAVAGTYYDFGADIGYASTKCTEGYWPTGPTCPIAYSGTFTFPSPASPESQSCK